MILLQSQCQLYQNEYETLGKNLDKVQKRLDETFQMAASQKIVSILQYLKKKVTNYFNSFNERTNLYEKKTDQTNRPLMRI